jgi:hypothetical protein
MNKFSDWVKKKGVKQKFLAGKLRISTSSLHQILRLGQLPSLKLAYNIETITEGDITLYDWIDEMQVIAKEKDKTKKTKQTSKTKKRNSGSFCQPTCMT